METQVFNGLTYTKYQGEKYYTRGLRKLHRDVWEFYNGTIPQGYEIHHIDIDPNNNSIDNLMCLSKQEHIQLHKELGKTEEQLEKNREHLDSVRYKATEWHQSEEGIQWHKEHYEMMKDKLYQEITIKCECCGKEFITKNNGKNKYCSNSCKSKARRESGVDNVERVCEICGNTFIINKYSKTRTCSRSCSTKLQHKNKKRG